MVVFTSGIIAFLCLFIYNISIYVCSVGSDGLMTVRYHGQCSLSRNKIMTLFFFTWSISWKPVMRKKYIIFQRFEFLNFPEFVNFEVKSQFWTHFDNIFILPNCAVKKQKGWHKIIMYINLISTVSMFLMNQYVWYAFRWMKIEFYTSSLWLC